LLTHADQPEVLIGAGTMALEIRQRNGLPDSVLISVMTATPADGSSNPSNA
jgi:threonine dehydratase